MPHGPLRRVVAIAGAAMVLLAVGLSAAVTFVLHRYDVPSSSMEPTLNRGDSFWAVSFGAAHRGDVVVIRAPATLRAAPASEIVTREVAVGGDIVEARGGKLLINGTAAVEPYLASGTQTRDIPRTEVPQGTIYVLGDNRLNSQGSWTYGPIRTSDVTHRLVMTNPPPTLLIYGLTGVILVVYVGFMERATRSQRAQQLS